jgi:hypothetical protein
MRMRFAAHPLGFGLAAVLPACLAAAALLAPTPARAQGSECPRGYRFIEYREVMLPDGPARQPYCLRSARLRLWFKIFIPGEHPGNPGYVLRTARGTGVIPSPEDQGLRLIPLLGLHGNCFATDDRSFSPDPRASARVTVDMNLLIEGGEIVRMSGVAGRPIADTGRTRLVDCASGVERASKKASPSGISTSSTSRSVTVSGGVSDPFYHGAGPRADLRLEIESRPQSRDLRVVGNVGTFPSFEGYYSLDGGPAQSLVLLPPAAGTTAWDLIELGTGARMRQFEGIIPL